METVGALPCVILILELLVSYDCGQICFTCKDVASKQSCITVVNCQNDEVCYLQKYRTQDGNMRYDMGCVYPEVCKKDEFGVIFGRSSDHSHVLCRSCCNNTHACNADLDCNHHFEVPTQNCYSCSEISDQTSCTNVTACGQNEVCFLHKYRTQSNQSVYDMGCIHSALCNHDISNPFGRRQSNGLHLECEACCSTSNLCNRNLSCDHLHHTKYAKECSDISSDQDGVYTIYPVSRNKPVNVYCIMGNAKKWTVIHKRSNATVDFNRNWQQYKDGFGSPFGEYWLGNDNIHAITSNGHHEISIYMISRSHGPGYANYSTFLVGDEQSGYLLTITGYHGNTFDAMQWSGYNLNGQKFTTKDRDNDNYYRNCAVEYPGGWWFNACHAAHLNGDVNKAGRKWSSWDSEIDYSVMMIRKTT